MQLQLNLSRATLALLLGAAMGSAPARAQAPVDVPAAENGKRVFLPAFFASYGPVSALDMVERIPGFSIEQGEDRRGFGENLVNVLIDGDRPSTKSESLQTILSRIPASQIDRIELIEQAGADGETRGVGQTVNVIRKGGSALTGTYDANVNFGTRYGILPFANVSATLKRGPTTYEVNFSSFNDKFQGFGPEDFLAGDRTLTERRSYSGRGRYSEASIGGAIRTRFGDAKLNVNGKIGIEDGIDRRRGIFTNASGAQVGTERLFTDQPRREIGYELGGDIEFPLAAKLTTKLVALYRNDQDKVDGFIEQLRPSGRFRSDTQTRNRPSEAVLRIQNDWSGFGNHAIQFGAELAYNRLDARFVNTTLADPAPPQISSVAVLVRETRIEPFVSDVWTLSPAWKLEGGAIFEFSSLKLTGDSLARRSFQFVKPRVAAIWTASKKTTMEFRAERQVAQLDFDEFATSVDLGLGGQVDSGNRDLVPQQVTTFSALVRQKFLERGSIQLLGSYEAINDTQDLVPVDLGGGVIVDGAGNIGRGKRWNAELEVTLPFDWATRDLGITGMELKFVGHYHGSRVTDPVTGEKRKVSFRPEWHQDWEFRHDIAKAGIAYGFKVQTMAPGYAYFVNQIRRQHSLLNIDNAFIEYRKLKLGTIRLSVEDLNGEPFHRERVFFSGTRASGVITSYIERSRKLDPRIRVSLTGKF